MRHQLHFLVKRFIKNLQYLPTLARALCSGGERGDNVSTSPGKTNPGWTQQRDEVNQGRGKVMGAGLCSTGPPTRAARQ